MYGDLYLWIKALHVISVMAWMAGLLYLPRLFVYHAAAEPGSTQSETFKMMERRLFFGIIHPSMAASIITGLLLVVINEGYEQMAIWLWLKVGLVFVGLGTFHVYLARWRKNFESDKNTKSTLFFRCANEIPTVLMIAIVVLVIIKPWGSAE